MAHNNITIPWSKQQSSKQHYWQCKFIYLTWFCSYHFKTNTITSCGFFSQQNQNKHLVWWLPEELLCVIFHFHRQCNLFVMAHNNIITPWSKRTIACTHIHTHGFSNNRITNTWSGGSLRNFCSGAAKEFHERRGRTRMSKFNLFILLYLYFCKYSLFILLYRSSFLFFSLSKVFTPLPLLLFLHMERSPALLRCHISKSLIKSEIFNFI